MENSPQETPKKTQESDLLDRFEQHYPGIFDDSIDTEQLPESIEESTVESLDTETYQYTDNETPPPEVEDSRVERAKRIAIRASKLLGNVALVTVAPLVTEVIQKTNANKKMRASYRDDHKNSTFSHKIQAAKVEFTGSVNDFKKINEKEKEVREQRRIDQQNRRKEFFS